MTTTATTTTTLATETSSAIDAIRGSIEIEESLQSSESRLSAYSVEEPVALEEEGSKDAMSAKELEVELTLSDDEFADRLGLQAARHKNKKQMEANVRKRYKYLKDEYTIAQAVEEMLETDRFDEALYLTRLASKDKDVVVSWNHVLKYMFNQGRTNAAIKLYQEMKKRGQVPSVRTFTVIFNGCSKAKNLEQAVLISTRIYYGMLTDSRLRPNVIHMNAVLETCARAKDIQAVFNIAKTANTSYRLPDCTTYTVILNAMRASTELPYEKAHKKNLKRKKHKADLDVGNPFLEKPMVTIRRARATWEEILLNWRRGFLLLDERLVCSMGRILHLGTVPDNVDVLRLVEQTMGIPRLDQDTSKAPSSKKNKALPKPTEQPTEPSAANANEDVESKPTLAVERAAAADPFSVMLPPEQKGGSQEVTQFSPIKPVDDYFYKPFVPKMTDPSPLYPSPGPNTLSLILAALATSRKTTLALPYWKLLTGPRYSIIPDIENCHQLLRTIKRGRSSADAIEALLLMPKFAYIGRTFQLAMEVCTVNTLNQNTFQAAGKILDLMNQTAHTPDASTLRLYLKVALTSNRHFLEAQDPKEAATGKAEFGKQVVRALQRLWDPVRIVGNNVQALDEAEAAGIKRDGAQQEAESKKIRLEYIDLLKLMVSATDMIVSEKMADDATIRDLSISRNLLNRQVTRFYAGEKPTAPINPEKRRVLGASYSKPNWDPEDLERSVRRRWTKQK